MKNYLRWSLRQFYLVFFWPTQFKREVEDDKELGRLKIRSCKRLRYLLNLLPCSTALTIFSTLAVGCTCAAFGVFFDWTNALLGVIAGMTFGLAVGVMFGVAGGSEGGLMGGIAGGLMGGITGEIVFSVAIGAMFVVLG